jgi:imidazolonepropionase-like amidohydrolase
VRPLGAVLASAAVVLALPSLAAAQQPPLAIRGARVVTVSGPVIEKGTVLVERGRIVAVGADADVAVPAGASVVDGTGKTLYPGLVDALTTLGLAEVQAVQATVDTTEVGDLNPQAHAWIALHPDSELIPVARANGVTTVVSAPAGGLVSGQSALVRLTGTTPASMVVKAPIALHVVYPSGRPPADVSRLFEEPELKTLAERVKDQEKNQKKALDRLASLLAEAKANAASEQDASRPAPETSLALDALAPFARGEAPVVIRADEEKEIRASVRFAADNGLKLVIAGGLEAWRCIDVLKEKDVPVLLKVERLPERESDPYDAPYANAAALKRAGVRFAIVSDDSENVRNLPYEAAMAAAYGLGEVEALRAITLSPAEILGAADAVGSIAPGREANLVLATGDILDTRTQVTHVFIQGVAQSLETRHTRLYERYKDRP